MASKDDAQIFRLSTVKDGSTIDLSSANDIVRRILELLYALEGRTGPSTIRDNLTVMGSLSLSGSASICGDLDPCSDNTYDLGDGSLVNPLRWRDLNLGRDVALGEGGVVKWGSDDTTTIKRDASGEMSLGSQDGTSFSRLNVYQTRGVPPADIRFGVDLSTAEMAITTGDAPWNPDLVLKPKNTEAGRFNSSRQFVQQSAEGAQWIRGQASELLTLTGLTTDTSSNLLPANALIQAVTVRVTQTITGSVTAFDVGDPVTQTRFATGLALSAGTTDTGRRQWRGSVTTDATGPTQESAAKVRITGTGGIALSGGQVRITVFYTQFVAPTT